MSTMNVCTNRLGTFTQHEPPWPYINDDSYHTPEEFANAGFYNVSTKRVNDKVQCYICNITLSDWRKGQSPLGRHAHSAKTCPLVLLNFPDALTTIPIVDQDPSTHPESEFMIKTRMKTFTKNRAWPPSSATGDHDAQSAQKRRTYPTSRKMTEAGFVFLPTLNEPDRVKCPYCQYCLSHLNITSNPWAQHQKAKPDCLYVTRRKAILPARRSSLPQKRSILTGPSTSATKKNRRATTGAHSKDNAAKSTGDQDVTSVADDNTNNEADDLSRFDDSIWDIAKAQLNYKKPPDLATATRLRPSNAKPLVTYERKKLKRSSKVLPPELTKPTVSATSSSSSSNTKQSKETAVAVPRTKGQQLATSSNSYPQEQTRSISSQQKEMVDETPAQVLARLQKKPIESISSKNKGKGRASDFTTAAPPNTNKLSKDSLRLSTTSKNSAQISPSKANPPELLSSSSSSTLGAAAATNSILATTATESTSGPMVSEFTASHEQQYRFFASTPSSQRGSNIGSSTPLPHSTPIHARTDHGNGLMALTLSPIRGAGTMTSATSNIRGGAFGSLDTPMTTNNRTGQLMDHGLDIGQQIEQRFRAKRRLMSPTRSTPQRDITATKTSDMCYSTASPLLDFDLTNDEPSTANNTSSEPHLTDKQLAMTVEQFIQNLVERKVDIVKQHGEQLIKNLQQEVADTKKSILTNHI